LTSKEASEGSCTRASSNVLCGYATLSPILSGRGRNNHSRRQSWLRKAEKLLDLSKF